MEWLPDVGRTLALLQHVISVMSVMLVYHWCDVHVSLVWCPRSQLLHPIRPNTDSQRNVTRMNWARGQAQVQWASNACVCLLISPCQPLGISSTATGFTPTPRTPYTQHKVAPLISYRDYSCISNNRDKNKELGWSPALTHRVQDPSYI